MKRLFASVFFIISAVLLLTACSMPKLPAGNTASRANGLGTAFTADTDIELDRLQAHGELKRMSEGEWEIEFDTPNTLSGVKLTFDLADSGTVGASYKGLEFSVPKSALPVKAMMLCLIEAADDAAHLEELTGEEKDGLLMIDGTVDGGEYTLSVDKDGNLAGFEMPSYKLKMTFSVSGGNTD